MKQYAMEIVAAVLDRPQMYTLAGSYEEVIAFLSGHFSGVSGQSSDLKLAAEWNAFMDWLSTNLGIERSGLWINLKQTYESNEELLQVMRASVNRYCDE